MKQITELKRIPGSLTAICLALAFTVLGCQTQQQQQAPSTPAPKPAPSKVEAKPKPAPSTRLADGWGSGDINTDLVRVNKRVPSEAGLGETYHYEHNLTAQDNLSTLTLTDTLGEGLAYVRSEPAASVNGQTLTWNFDDVAKGKQENIKVWVKAAKEGTLTTCTEVDAVPQVCLATFVGKPAIAITKTGPARASLGDMVAYEITVSNSGTAVAKDVHVIDTVPDGLSHQSGGRSLRFNVGDLAPNQSKKIPVSLKADKRGQHCNKAVVNTANAGSANAEACTTVVEPGIDITKTGTKEQYILKTASYDIVVSNTGDTDLSNVVVTDTAPNATRITSAAGGQISGNRATWNIGNLKAGEKRNLKVVLSSATPGNHCNEVSVVAAGGLKDSAQACTLWKGLSAILIEVVDNPDPIQVGEDTTYTIRVTNQGSADDTNIKIVASFPAQVTPSSATGGRIEGKTVTFPAVPKLAPKQSFSYTISAKGANVGDGRIKVVMDSDQLDSNVTEEESTRVY